MDLAKFKDLGKLLNIYNLPRYVVKKPRSEEGIDGRLVSYTDRTSYIAEQYKVLRTNLYSMASTEHIKTIVITSSQAQEGKTITSCNLSTTLSLDQEKKVLLIDCDLRRPAVHNIFGISRKPGFSDVLAETVDMDEFLEKPVIGNLFIMPAGTIKSNPSEILTSTKIKNLIDGLKQKFDYIIFDTPPVLNVTDSSILGSLCDAVLFVVRAGVTPRNMVEEALEMLTEAQAKPKGCILTNVHYLLDSYYYFYRYKYYKYAPEKKE